MDDPNKTNHILEALADLFLTGTAGAAGGQEAKPALPAVSSGSAPAGGEKKETRGDGLDGPAPIRLGPKVVLTPPSRMERREPRGAAVIGTIGAEGVVNGPAGVSGKGRGVPAKPAALQAVVLGSLPGFAGPWLAQYADHVAREAGAVVIARLEDRGIEVELVAGAAEDGGASPEIAGKWASPVEMMEEVVRGGGGQRVGAVLLHVAEGGVLGTMRIPEWVVVCGAYDAAVADAARRLEELAAHWPADYQPLVKMMVMGSDEEKAAVALRKLAAATAGFLPGGIKLAGVRKQMQPVRRQELGAFEPTAEHWGDFKAYLEALVEEAEAAQVARRGSGMRDLEADIRKQETTPPAPSAWSAPQAAEEARLVEVDMERVQPSAAEPQGRGEAPVAPPAARRVSAWATEPAMEPTGDSGEMNVAELLAGEIPGGMMLAARHPRLAETTMFVDEAGRLHLTARAVGAKAGDDKGQTAAVHAAVVGLVEARLWAKEHAQLLALTQRQCRFDLEARPVLHLLTDQARLGALLATRLGDELRVHVVQQVKVGSAKVWTSMALNV